MHDLSAILAGASAAVGHEYFLLPVLGADPVYRERVYCYELYHQMRRLWPKGCAYCLNGEIDKRSHPYFADGRAPKPDFLVHEPGTSRNHAVFEVKSVNGSGIGTKKDIGTLLYFKNSLRYERAIYLVYGAYPGEAIERLSRCGISTSIDDPIELWVHTKPGVEAFRVHI